MTRTQNYSRRLLKDHDAPVYVREKAITIGYRRRLSYAACLKSWFWLHNETINIWSHLVGFILFSVYLADILLNRSVESSSLSLVPIVIQLLSYMFCMLSSSLFHTFACHSEPAYNWWLQKDHLGVVVALFGTYVSFIVECFGCQPEWCTFHLTATVCIFSGILFFSSQFNSDSETRVKLHLFIYLALYPAVFITHWIWMRGGVYDDMVWRKMKGLSVPYGCFVVGLSFYLSRFPEVACKGGSMDLVGASHQIWHLNVFGGMAYWYSECASTFFGDSVCALNGTAGGTDAAVDAASIGDGGEGGNLSRIVSNISGLLIDSTFAIWQSIAAT